MTQHLAAPTRRTVLRAAAWSAPAVTIAVAAPAFATSHEVSAPSATAMGKRESKDLYPVFTLIAGSSTLSGISAVVTVGPGEIDARWGTVGGGWTRSEVTATSATYTYTGQLAAGRQLELAPFIRLTKNPDDVIGVNATVTFIWDGGTTGASVRLGK